MAKPTRHQIELLHTSYNSHLLATAAVERGDFSQAANMVRSLNVMFDHAMDCGMSYDEPDVLAWVAPFIAADLVSA